jgi:hypothetical protein
MHGKPTLAERSEPFVFDHKPSEVNYGGQTRFHQAAFPPAEGEKAGWEERVLGVVQGFVHLLRSAAASAGTENHAPGRDPETADIYFDQFCASPRLSSPAFLQWLGTEVDPLGEAYRRLRINALRQENEKHVPGLNVWAALAAVTLAADVIREYFEKDISLDRATVRQARLTLGRVLARALRGAESHGEVLRWRQEKFGIAEPDPEVLRLLNPLALAWAGSLDDLAPERLLDGLNPYRLSAKSHATWLEFFTEFFKTSRCFDCPRPIPALAEPRSWAAVWSHPRERARLLKWMRRERDFRELLARETACEQLRQWFRTHPGSRGEGESPACLGSERFLEELISDSGARGRFLKALRARRPDLVQEARAQLEAVRRFLRRAHRQGLWRFSRLELTELLAVALSRWTRFLTEAEDARFLSARFARGQQAEPGRAGLKLWRGCELTYAESAEGGPGRLRCLPVWARQQLDLENAFAEGNLFLLRTQGDIYPGERERRQQSTFLFADLRNSTETTMKLTKDTASYLTPYLTAVDTEAQAAQGERIYFAGDGYAAHYLRAADALRAAHNLAGRFIQLRSQSTEEHRRRVKSLYTEGKALRLPWLKPPALEKSLGSLPAGTGSAEVRVFLQTLASEPEENLTEAMLMKVLIKVASDFCMPRVEVGVGLTCGELFQAMVGAEDRPKYPIVISPALTQAARLSGSSDAVKKYIEDHLPQPFPFHAYAWDQKLFNRGIVITDEVFEKLQTEVHLKKVEHKIKIFEKERFLYYYDTRLNKRLILRDIQETIILKGISRPCHIYEVILPYSVTDKLFGTSEE